jgi:hypothetical protein
MRNPQQIIFDLKHTIHCSQPNVRFYDLIQLVNELEHSLNTKSSQEEILSMPAPVVEEVVAEEVTIEDVIEEFTIEDIAEEVTVEDVTGEITTKKTKSKK